MTFMTTKKKYLKEELDEAGIHWVNCPGCNASSVGQYVETSLMRIGITSGEVVG